MGGWSWLCCGRSNAGGAAVRLPEPFHLPAPLPEWPQGLGLPLSLSLSLRLSFARFLSLFVLTRCVTSCCALGWVVFRG